MAWIQRWLARRLAKGAGNGFVMAQVEWARRADASNLQRDTYPLRHRLSIMENDPLLSRVNSCMSLSMTIITLHQAVHSAVSLQVFSFQVHASYVKRLPFQSWRNKKTRSPPIAWGKVTEGISSWCYYYRVPFLACSFSAYPYVDRKVVKW